MTDRSEFIEAAKAQAFTMTDPESSEHGRTLIHCQGSVCGADWDLDGVLSAIESADLVRWNTQSFAGAVLGHQLEVREGDRRWAFAVRRPEVVAE